MSLEIHVDIKPLSANLKRLNVGKQFIKKEFEYLLEENNLDNYWNLCKDKWSSSNSLNLFGPDYKKYTESYIIALNYAYVNYIESPNEKSKDIFNDLIVLGFTFFTENDTESQDLSKLISTLKLIDILTSQTISTIELIQKAPKQIVTEMKSTNRDFNNIKYQIFISSTYIDLKEERQAVVEAILRKGHIPAGMELFAANDKSQWEVIKKWIDDSDIYCLILGGRYGSIDKKTGLSYTEMEYNYAIKKNKPFFALVLGDNIIDNKERHITKDYDLKDPLYINFKSTITSKMCSFPNSIEQIKLETNHSLDNLINENKEKLIGWIKGNNNGDK